MKTGCVTRSRPLDRISNFLLSFLLASAFLLDTQNALGSQVWPFAKAEAFPLKEVRLRSSPFKKAMEIDRRYLLSLDPNRLLWPFYERAGLPTKGDRYGGWERLDCVGHILGHYLSACSLMYAGGADGEIKKRIDYIVSEIARVQKKHGNGYAGPVRTEVWKEVFSGKFRVGAWGLGGGYVPWYVVHKTFSGLLDAYVNAGNKLALRVACEFAQWAKRGTDKLNDAQFQRMLRCEHGGMLDVLVRLYALTGKKDFMRLARRFDHKAVFDPLAGQRDILTGKHANTLIPKIIGACLFYKRTGEERHWKIAEFFWHHVVPLRSFAPGGVDFHEHFRAPNEEAKWLGWDSCETCAVYNMLKLTKELFSCDPKAVYMDYYEQALYNHILGSQDPKTGGFTYFYSLKPGHFKVYSTPFDSMWCCVGTGMENHARYAESIYFHNGDTLWVNLFIPSELRWRERKIKVLQENSFPFKDSTTLTFFMEKPKDFTLKIRHPYWCKGEIDMKLNGEKVPCRSKPQSYLAIRRRWKDKDRVEIKFSMSVRLERAKDDKKVGVLFYGPLVLAGQLGTEGMPEKLNVTENRQYAGLPTPPVPVLVCPPRDTSSWVKRMSSDQLVVRTEGVAKPKDVSLLPIGLLHRQRYTVYWRILSKEEWEKEEEKRIAEEKRRKDIEARTIDSLIPEPDQEKAHNLKGERTYSGAAFGRRWRDARGGGWFAFDMKILPDVPIDLLVTYWGSDTGGRIFDVLVDGVKIATQTLNRQKPGEFFDVIYPIPENLTKGKKRINVKFHAHPGRIAGGIFGCRTIKSMRIREEKDEDQELREKAEAFFKKLDPFYKKLVVVKGLPIVSSEKVRSQALEEVAYLVKKLLAKRPDILRELVSRGAYVSVMAYNEMQTDLPECRHMSLWWAKRARGLGGRNVSCGEENLLSFPGDPYKGENIFIHEFAHALHGAFTRLDKGFSEKLAGLYKKAKESGRFRGYGMTTIGEFFAEGVQSYFSCNRQGGLELVNSEGKVVCRINTRGQLKKYMLEYAKFLEKCFGGNEWVYVPVLKRLNEPHLKGYDPSKAPTFRWPKHVLEAYYKIEAEKAKRRKEAQKRRRRKAE